MPGRGLSLAGSRARNEAGRADTFFHSSKPLETGFLIPGILQVAASEGRLAIRYLIPPALVPKLSLGTRRVHIGFPLSTTLIIPQKQGRLVADQLSPGFSNPRVVGARGQGGMNPGQRLGMVGGRVKNGHFKACTAIPGVMIHHFLKFQETLPGG